MSIVITHRINDAAEEVDRFCPEQAGFRQLEECVTQAACVVDALQRRGIARERSCLLFVDFKKAYDMVPHEALFIKLYKFGVRGKCLQFIRGLYATSNLRVRLGQGVSTTRTPSFSLLRGVRQGCPLSPTLFNVFINDIFDGMSAAGLGMHVPHGTTKNPGFYRMTGALFADDAVIFAEDLRGLQEAANHISTWQQRHEMAFGIKKCGVLDLWKNASNDLPEDRSLLPITLSNEAVPEVDSYEYLGMTLIFETPNVVVDMRDYLRKMLKEFRIKFRSIDNMSLFYSTTNLQSR